jgi:hypothetical protein
LHTPGETTWECSEYEPLVVFSEMQNLFLKASAYQDATQMPEHDVNIAIKNDSCFYYSPEIFIFTCENYQ